LLKVIIFNVERGFCSFVRSPNNYALLIDCGSSANFSPIKYILDNEIPYVTEIEGYKLAHFVCSHPHDDHISDIERLKKELEPKTITGWRFTWDEVKDPDEKDENAYLNLDSYGKLRDSYTATSTPTDWGMTFETLGLSVSDAKKINPDRQRFANNSSIAVMLQYMRWKFFFSGDLMEDGWEELLKRDSFQNALKGTDFFITPHHGHKSGYNSKIYEVMGKPEINIVSEKSGEEVYTAYSDSEHAIGIKINEQTRRALTTRKDGSIVVKISDEGNASITLRNLKDNV
jgi:beta-lactamase superfamily II metal-dependent hydrolase